MDGFDALVKLIFFGRMENVCGEQLPPKCKANLHGWHCTMMSY